MKLEIRKHDSLGHHYWLARMLNLSTPSAFDVGKSYTDLLRTVGYLDPMIFYRRLEGFLEHWKGR